MKSAIIVIDVQHGIFGSANKPYESELTVKNICKAIEHERSRGSLIAFIQHEAPGIVEYGSKNWNLYDAMPVTQQDIKIRKSNPDAFINTELEGTLKEFGITDLIICGYSSDFCIDRTSFKAACLGYNIRLIRDAHTTHDKPHLNAEKIRDHHNFILSQHPAITLIDTLQLLNS